jgi:hypothetical protein
MKELFIRLIGAVMRKPLLKRLWVLRSATSGF